jgi:outer membrane protein OmpA-like peptidoglycan-associated protein
VQGVVLQKADARKVTLAFQQIPGVKTVTNTVELQAKAFASRIYFERGSSELKSAELSKVSQIQSFLEQYPNTVLRLLGYSDALGTSTENQQMALARATSVRNALVTQGIDPKRLQVEGTSNSPIGLDSDQPFQLSRCVEFEIVTP